MERISLNNSVLNSVNNLSERISSFRTGVKASVLWLLVALWVNNTAQADVKVETIIWWEKIVFDTSKDLTENDPCDVFINKEDLDSYGKCQDFSLNIINDELEKSKVELANSRTNLANSRTNLANSRTNLANSEAKLKKSENSLANTYNEMRKEVVSQ